jgi:hypothetical protein
MFALPSVWNLVISTLVFIIAAKYLRAYLEEQGLPKGVTRGVLVFSLASLLSWGSGEAVDWTEEKIEGPKPQAATTSDDISQLLNALGQAQSSAAPKEPVQEN